MSTRANIIIKDSNDTFYFYRHSDGYPSQTGTSLKKFVQGYSSGKFRDNAMQSAGWLVLHGAEEYKDCGYSWKVGAYEPTTSLHGDIEFIYIIDLNEGTLTIKQGRILKAKTIETISFKTVAA